MFTFAKFCRLCLKNNHFLVSYAEVDLENVSYYDKIKKMIPLLVTDDCENFPTWICILCREELDQFYTFHEKCIDTHGLLKKYSAQLCSLDPKNHSLKVENTTNTAYNIHLSNYEYEKPENSDIIKTERDNPEIFDTDTILLNENSTESTISIVKNEIPVTEEDELNFKLFYKTILQSEEAANATIEDDQYKNVDQTVDTKQQNSLHESFFANINSNNKEENSPQNISLRNIIEATLDKASSSQFDIIKCISPEASKCRSKKEVKENIKTSVDKSKESPNQSIVNIDGVSKAEPEVTEKYQYIKTSLNKIKEPQNKYIVNIDEVFESLKDRSEPEVTEKSQIIDTSIDKIKESPQRSIEYVDVVSKVLKNTPETEVKETSRIIDTTLDKIEEFPNRSIVNVDIISDVLKNISESELTEKSQNIDSSLEKTEESLNQLIININGLAEDFREELEKEVTGKSQNIELTLDNSKESSNQSTIILDEFVEAPADILEPEVTETSQNIDLGPENSKKSSNQSTIILDELVKAPVLESKVTKISKNIDLRSENLKKPSNPSTIYIDLSSENILQPEVPGKSSNTKRSLDMTINSPSNQAFLKENASWFEDLKMKLKAQIQKNSKNINAASLNQTKKRLNRSRLSKYIHVSSIKFKNTSGQVSERFHNPPPQITGRTIEIDTDESDSTDANIRDSSRLSSLRNKRRATPVFYNEKSDNDDFSTDDDNDSDFQPDLEFVDTNIFSSPKRVKHTYENQNRSRAKSVISNSSGKSMNLSNLLQTDNQIDLIENPAKQIECTSYSLQSLLSSSKPMNIVKPLNSNAFDMNFVNAQNFEPTNNRINVFNYPENIVGSTSNCSNPVSSNFGSNIASPFVPTIASFTSTVTSSFVPTTFASTIDSSFVPTTFASTIDSSFVPTTFASTVTSSFVPTRAPPFASTIASSSAPTRAPPFASTIASSSAPTRAPPFASTIAPSSAPTRAPPFASTIASSSAPTIAPSSFPPTRSSPCVSNVASRLVPTISVVDFNKLISRPETEKHQQINPVVSSNIISSNSQYASSNMINLGENNCSTSTNNQINRATTTNFFSSSISNKSHVVLENPVDQITHEKYNENFSNKKAITPYKNKLQIKSNPRVETENNQQINSALPLNKTTSVSKSTNANIIDLDGSNTSNSDNRVNSNTKVFSRSLLYLVPIEFLNSDKQIVKTGLRKLLKNELDPDARTKNKLLAVQSVASNNSDIINLDSDDCIVQTDNQTNMNSQKVEENPINKGLINAFKNKLQTKLKSVPETENNRQYLDKIVPNLNTIVLEGDNISSQAVNLNNTNNPSVPNVTSVYFQNVDNQVMREKDIVLNKEEVVGFKKKTIPRLLRKPEIKSNKQINCTVTSNKISSNITASNVTTSNVITSNIISSNIIASNSVPSNSQSACSNIIDFEKNNSLIQPDKQLNNITNLVLNSVPQPSSMSTKTNIVDLGNSNCSNVTENQVNAKTEIPSGLDSNINTVDLKNTDTQISNENNSKINFDTKEENKEISPVIPDLVPSNSTTPNIVNLQSNISSIQSCSQTNTTANLTSDEEDDDDYFLEKYFCNYCNKKFPSNIDLELHKKSHQGDDGKDFCIYCRYEFPSRKRLMAHYKRSHFDVVNCALCDKKFDTHDLLATHLYSHYGLNVLNCPKCEKLFLYSKKLYLHLQDVHKEITFNCYRCGKFSTSAISAYKHMVKSHGTFGSYLCHICGKKYFSIGKLNFHLGAKHSKNEKHVCSYCGKQYSQVNTLRSHILSNHERGTFKCEVCSKEYASKLRLFLHLRTHFESKKRYECKTCKKKFLHKVSLLNHERTHTGEKPFKCKICNKAFSQEVSVVVHMRTHTGQKPFKCQVCGKRFTQSYVYKMHLKRHDNNDNKSDKSDSSD